MMSHEIRTPLFGIVGNTSLLKETDITSDQRSFIDTIDGSARLMMSVIQDILDFSQIEAGKLNLNKVSFSLGRMLGQVSKIVEDSALRKSLGYSISIPNEDYILEGDLHRFQQIIINLSSNALKFTHNGKVSIDVKAENLETGQVGLRLTFADTGIGMTKEISKKLFSPWTQADSSNRRLYGGSGLGLAITKSLVDMMGGTIGLSTEKEVGSTFWVELTFPRGNTENPVNESPLSPDSPLKAIKFEFYDLQEASKYISNFNRNKSADHQTKNGNSSKKMHSTIAQTKRANNNNDVNTRPTKEYKANKNRKSIGDKNGLPKGKRFQVLLAEDNPVNQAILVRFLEKMGCIECELTSDGQQALNAYRSRSLGHYHVILLDQSMPKMDGDEVCREIRKMDPDQVVISVSANALLSDRTHFLEIGMNDHISKPVTFVNFRETVTKWLLKVNNQSKDKETNGKNENENENKNENR
ncbi:hypothetical protein K502DRAFT_287315 [Neoconidiobolus thromboides FSU 785]|nr:hypothetical protein K502DRAFT_287315 [Neoconidiobolus thromboides FSU 785]